MPFIKPERRAMINSGKIPEEEFEPGDRCFIFYSSMMAQWKADPRWTTAHHIYQSHVLCSKHRKIENQLATELAWQVFFQLHVMPYEIQKREENGDI